MVGQRESWFIYSTGDNGKHVRKRITEVVWRFEQWLQKRGEDTADFSGAPKDRKGHYIGTVNAKDLVGVYLAECPDDARHKAELRRHASEIGELWNGERGRCRLTDAHRRE
jgi:hypothetical protein